MNFQRIRDSLPVHYAGCDKVDSQAEWALDCDCTATADIEALLDHVKRQDEQLDSAARYVLSLVDPDGTYAPTPDDPKDLQR